MLYLTTTVGYQSAIYDSDDGTLEWIPNHEIKKCIEQGMEIKKAQPVISQAMCNINKDRSNLFENCKSVHVIGDSVTIINKFGKKFKGTQQGSTLYLNVGLIVRR